MIREAEVKKAFRIAYNTLDKCGEPVNDPEYLQGVIAKFEQAWKDDQYNELLKYLSIGICEWLGSLAMKGDRK